MKKKYEEFKKRDGKNTYVIDWCWRSWRRQKKLRIFEDGKRRKNRRYEEVEKG